MRRKVTETVSFRISPEDRAELERQAAASDWSLSKLLRRGLLASQAAARPAPASLPAQAPGRVEVSPSPVRAAVAGAQRGEAPVPTTELQIYHIDELQSDPLRTESGALKK